MNERILSMLNGVSGYGKSYFAKNKLIPVLAKIAPVIIFDKNSEYAGKNKKDVPKNAGWKSYSSIFSFLKKNADSQSFGGVHVIECTHTHDYTHGINFFYALKLPVTLIIDEGHFIFDEPELKNLAAVIKNIARFGRHSGLGLVMISQRSMDIPPDVRSQFDSVISFHQTEPADVQHLKKRGFKDAEKILEFDRRKYQIFGDMNESLKKMLK